MKARCKHNRERAVQTAIPIQLELDILESVDGPYSDAGDPGPVGDDDPVLVPAVGPCPVSAVVVQSEARRHHDLDDSQASEEEL